MKTNPSTKPRAAFCLLLGSAALLLASCGKQRDWKPVFPTQGKLLMAGKPAEKATLIFCPLDNPDARAPRPVGKSGADGSFRLSTYTANDGAPTGQYAVTVIWPELPPGAPPDMDEGPDRLKGRCSNPKTSPWRIQIEEKPCDLGTLDLGSWASTASAEKPAFKD